MKKICMGIALTLLIGIACSTFSEGDILIDVVNGRFIGGGYELPLADMDAPIAVRVLNGEVLVNVTTPDGVVELNLGPGQLTLTNYAAGYVAVMVEADVLPEEWEDYEICPVCGRSTAFGRHQPLACGHYGCLVSLDHPIVCSACGKFTCDRQDHSRCAYCGQGKCVHTVSTCEYLRNPAPTPFSTKDPDGKTVYSYSDPEGNSVYGTPDGKPPATWAPGNDFAETPPPADSGSGGTAPGGGRP